jgi:putative membrane protein
MPDPRVFFAAERTLLAWIRSGLTVIALGFVVARFGLFLTLIAASNAAGARAHTGHWPSSAMGIALVALGASTILAALHNHRAYIRSLPPDDRPKLPLPWLTSFLSLAVAAVGILLAVYLALA